MDLTTERKLMSIIRRRLSGWTIVSFLRNKEAAAEFDRVLILDEGEVVGFGTLEEVALQFPKL